jgi:hypothetical protein
MRYGVEHHCTVYFADNHTGIRDEDKVVTQIE